MLLESPELYVSLLLRSGTRALIPGPTSPACLLQKPKAPAKAKVQTMNNTLSFGPGGWGIGPAVVEPKGKLTQKTAAVKGIDESLPPIVALDDIFTDLVGKVDLSATLNALNGRKLRVGTMCRCACYSGCASACGQGLTVRVIQWNRVATPGTRHRIKHHRERQAGPEARSRTHLFRRD